MDRLALILVMLACPACASAQALHTETEIITPSTTAPTQINTDAEAFDIATLAVDAFRKKQYGVFTGLMLMLIVFGLRRLRAFRRVDKKWSPWIACGLGIVFSIGTVFAAGRPPITALTHGFVLGASAVGLWEMVGKHLLPPERSDRV